MKRLLAGLLSSALFAAQAFAGTAPLAIGPWDPSAPLGSLNSWIAGSLNPYAYDVVFSLPAAVTTSGTGAYTFASYTIPANTLHSGETFHVVVFGQNSADSNVKTVTFNFGALSCALIVTGTSQFWQAEWRVVVTTAGSAGAETEECHGTTATTVVTSAQSVSGSVATNANVSVTVTGTAASSGTMTANMVTMAYDQ
jgi:hypothetical protein